MYKRQEVKFEDFEADAMGMTEDIYKSLSIPGFAEARGDIEKYLSLIHIFRGFTALILVRC